MDAEITVDPHQNGEQTTGFYRSVLFPVAALLLAVTGQWLLSESGYGPLAGTLVLGIALLLYLFSLAGWNGATLTPVARPASSLNWRPIVGSSAWRAAFAFAALILAVVSYRRFAGNALDRGFWFWIGAIFLFLLAFAQVPNCGIKDCASYIAAWWHRLDKRVVLLLCAIVLLAIFFRFFRLQEIPLEMTSDHAEKIWDVQDVLDGRRPIFFTRNTGREMFQFYLTAGLIRLFGLANSHLSLKIGTALFGTLAIPSTFLLCRLLYGRFAGLLAAFFLSISHWHVAIARVGLRFPFTAAFATPVLYFLLLALLQNRRNDWLLAGLFLGIGLHTYTAMRIVPLLCIVLVALKLLSDGIKKLRRKPAGRVNGWSRSFWANGMLATLLSALLLLPLIRYAADDPNGLWIRSLSRAQPAAQPARLDLLRVFLENLKNALLMFNVRGDVVAVNTIPYKPVLGLVSGGLFVLGLSYLLWNLIKRGDHRSVFLLVSLFFLLLPSILSLAFPGENPSVVRTGGAVPIVMIIVAVPLVTIVTRVYLSPYRWSGLAVTVVAALLLTAAVTDNYIWYFRDYNEQLRYSLSNSTELGQVLTDFENSGGDVANAYHIAFPHWVDTRTIGINAGHVRWNNAVLAKEELKEHVTAPRPRLYLVYKDDWETLSELQELFPDGHSQRFYSSRVGRDFFYFYVPARRPETRYNHQVSRALEDAQGQIP